MGGASDNLGQNLAELGFKSVGELIPPESKGSVRDFSDRNPNDDFGVRLDAQEQSRGWGLKLPPETVVHFIYPGQDRAATLQLGIYQQSLLEAQEAFTTGADGSQRLVRVVSYRDMAERSRLGGLVRSEVPRVRIFVMKPEDWLREKDACSSALKAEPARPPTEELKPARVETAGGLTSLVFERGTSAVIGTDPQKALGETREHFGNALLVPIEGAPPGIISRAALRIDRRPDGSFVFQSLTEKNGVSVVHGLNSNGKYVTVNLPQEIGGRPTVEETERFNMDGDIRNVEIIIEGVRGTCTIKTGVVGGGPTDKPTQSEKIEFRVGPVIKRPA